MPRTPAKSAKPASSTSDKGEPASSNFIRQAIEVGLKVSMGNDGEILDLNQVVSYFAYVNRSVVGLGVPIDEGPLGLSPDDTSDSYRHR